MTKFATFLTTEVLPFHPNGRPTDLAPKCARGSRLRPMSALNHECGERGFHIHCRDQPIKAEHLSLSSKEACAKDPIKRAIPPQQLRGAFWPDAGRARQFVRRVTAERNEVRHLVWINAISLPDLFGPDAREFATPRRVEDSRR